VGFRAPSELFQREQARKKGRRLSRDFTKLRARHGNDDVGVLEVQCVDRLGPMLRNVETFGVHDGDRVGSR
jgi:hypothetical protein